MPQEAREEFVMEHGEEDDFESGGVLPKPEDLSVEPEVEDAETVDEGNDDLEIEIVDDTPEEDKGRKPMSEKEKREALEADTDEFSENVKKRIAALTRANHDARREREQLERELAESARMNQAQYQREQALMQQRQQESQWAFQNAAQYAELEMQSAIREMEDAHEEGDSARTAEAQARMTRAQLYKQQVDAAAQQRAAQAQHYTQQQVAQPQQQAYTQEQPPETRAPQQDPRLERWVSKNRWFEGSSEDDQKLTAAAKAAHYQLESRGVTPDADDYYDQIDTEMRKAYPDHFGVKRKQPPSTVVAQSGRVPAGRRVVLTSSEVRLAKRIGITPKQYAEQKLKMGQD